MARPNRDILSGGERYRSRKTKSHRVDEVTFDKEKRKEFLTGFHKRKLQRRKRAQEQKEEQSRLSRIEERAQIREARKLRVQQRLSELKELNDKLAGGDSDDDDDTEGDDDDEQSKSSGDEDFNGKKRKRVHVKKDDEYEEWHGFKESRNGSDDDDDDDSDENDSNDDGKEGVNKKGILKVKQVYDVQDEDAPVVGTSEVTIEAMENPNDIVVEEIAKQNNVDLSKSKEVLENSVSRAKEYARLMGMDDGEVDEDEPKRKRRKKKQRKYLSKRERKIKKVKEKKRSMHRKNRL